MRILYVRVKPDRFLKPVGFAVEDMIDFFILGLLSYELDLVMFYVQLKPTGFKNLSGLLIVIN